MYLCIKFKRSEKVNISSSPLPMTGTEASDLGLKTHRKGLASWHDQAVSMIGCSFRHSLWFGIHPLDSGELGRLEFVVS